MHSFKSDISVSNTPVGCLRLNSIGFQSHMPWSFTFLVQDSQTGELNMGLRTLTSMGEPLLYNCSPVCGTLEKEMETSSILAWDIPRIVEPGGLKSIASQSQTRLSTKAQFEGLPPSG